jgi:2-octaprenylphenol hydroxylase
MTMARRADAFSIVIAGAGPIGLGIAARLKAGPAADRVSLQIVDPGSAPAWSAATLDTRVYALSRSSQALLETSGAWARIIERRAGPYRRMCIWEGDDPNDARALRFDCADIGEPDLGHVVEDNLLRAGLLEQLERAGNTTVTFGDSVRAVSALADDVTIELGSGEVLSSALLIAADGGRSEIRRLVGMPVVERSYGQQALVTHIETERDHEETAWQRFLPGGPIAFLPLSDGRSSVVWSVADPDAALLSAEDDRLIEALEAASGGFLGRIRSVSPRAVFPLAMRHAPAYCRHRVVLVGDAAHTIHPLAGQGMNLGFLDASELVHRIERAIERGEDPGDLKVLRRYERARKGDNLGMLVSLDLLDRLFRLPRGFGPLRTTGLGLVDCAPPLKRLFMQRALGLSSPSSRR